MLPPTLASSQRIQKKTKLVTAEANLALREHGDLRLAVVADTHSRLHPQALALIGALDPAAILHAGDIGDLSVLDELATLAPVIAVRGNIDERVTSIPDVVTVDIRSGETSALKLLLLHIAVYGPRIRADAAKRATDAGARLVVCGHSHVPFVGSQKGLAVFNPGSVGPRRLHLPIVFGVLEIAAGKLSLRHIDCETGQAWTP